MVIQGLCCPGCSTTGLSDDTRLRLASQGFRRGFGEPNPTHSDSILPQDRPGFLSSLSNHLEASHTQSRCFFFLHSEPALGKRTSPSSVLTLPTSLQEHTILNRLEFKLTVPTPYVFLVRFLKAAGPDRVDAFRDSYQVLPSIDDGNIKNQLAVVEYVEDIYKFYRTIEDVSSIPPDYMRNPVKINAKMRAIVIDWLVEVHLELELMPETLYLTVNTIDGYLSIQRVYDIKATEIQA